MIMAYHRINPWYKKDALTVLPESFERQTRYLLKKGFKPVFPDDYFANCLTFNTLLLTTFDDGYADNLWYAVPVLKKNGITPLIFLTVNYIGTQNIFNRYRDKEKDRFLNWDEVKQLAADDVIFGSHSLSHPHLSQVEDNRLWAEVSESKKTIEDRTGKEASFFCYPYGDFDERVIETVQKAGYKGAVVTPGVRGNVKKGPYIISRTGIYGHNGFLAFRIKIWKDYLTEKYL